MPQQQQQRVCTPMVVVAFVIGCQVAVMVMHAGRHDAHVAREQWHLSDFAAPAVPLPTERAPSTTATIERRAEVPAPPERRAAFGKPADEDARADDDAVETESSLGETTTGWVTFS